MKYSDLALIMDGFSHLSNGNRKRAANYQKKVFKGKIFEGQANQRSNQVWPLVWQKGCEIFIHKWAGERNSHKKIHFYFFVVANLNNAVMKDNSMQSKMVEVNFIAWQTTYGSFSEQNSPGSLLHRGQHSHWPNTFTLPPPQYKYFWHCKRD